MKGMMTEETAVEKAKEIAERVLAPIAGQHDKEARFSTEAVDALGKAGLLGLPVPADREAPLSPAHQRPRSRSAPLYRVARRSEQAHARRSLWLSLPLSPQSSCPSSSMARCGRSIRHHASL